MGPVNTLTLIKILHSLCYSFMEFVPVLNYQCCKRVILQFLCRGSIRDGVLWRRLIHREHRYILIRRTSDHDI